MSPPAQVMNVNASAPSSNQVTLSWDSQPGAIRYNVKRSAVSGGPYAMLAPPPVLTSSGYTDTTVAPSTTYYYVVSASSVAGEGPNSEAAVTTPAGTPTTTTVSSSLDPSTYGQSVTFNATASSGAGTPGGTMTFTDGGATLGSSALNASGQATLSTSTAGGSALDHCGLRGRRRFHRQHFGGPGADRE